MPEIWKFIINSLGTAGVVTVLFGWWIHRYLDRRVSVHLNTIEARLRANEELSVSLRKDRLSCTALLLPELQSCASKYRNFFREIAQHQKAQMAADLEEAGESFTDLLYGSQLFLKPATYNSAHEYKWIIDRISLALDVSSQKKTKVLSSTLVAKEMLELNTAYSRLEKCLRREFDALGNATQGVENA